MHASSSTSLSSIRAHLRFPTPTDLSHLRTPSRTHLQTLLVPASRILLQLLRRLEIHLRAVVGDTSEREEEEEVDAEADTDVAAAAEMHVERVE